MIFITALIYIYEGSEEAFQEYESLVLPLLAAFKGQLHHRIRCPREADKSIEDQPYEIHVLSFESEQDFQNYLGDKRRLSLEPLKKKTIKSTSLYRGQHV